MDSALEKLDINASARDIEDYLERFEIWCMTKGNVKEDTKPALFLNFIGKDAYALVRNLTFPDSPIAMPYEKIRNALISALRRGWKESEKRRFLHSIHDETNYLLHPMDNFVFEIGL